MASTKTPKRRTKKKPSTPKADKVAKLTVIYDHDASSKWKLRLTVPTDFKRKLERKLSCSIPVRLGSYESRVDAVKFATEFVKALSGIIVVAQTMTEETITIE